MKASVKTQFLLSPKLFYSLDSQLMLRIMKGDEEGKCIPMEHLTIKYDELTAEEFIGLWESVWGDGPSLEQTRLALSHTLFRISVFDGEKIIAMARMLGDMGLDYYIKDVVVRPEYQHRGIGRRMLQELLKFINDNGIPGTGVFVELTAEPDKAPFYRKLGFDSSEAIRLKMMKPVE